MMGSDFDKHEKGKILYEENVYNYYSRKLPRLIVFMIIVIVYCVILISVIFIPPTNNIFTNLAFFIFITLITLIVLILIHSDYLTLTRFIIYEKGLIPPNQTFSDFLLKNKHMKFFNEIIEMHFVQVSKNPDRYDISLVIDFNRKYLIPHYFIGQKALDILKDIKNEKYPDEKFEYFKNAEELLQSMRYEESLDLIDKALKLNPNNFEYWNLKGCSLGELKKYNEALEAFNKSIALSSNYSNAWVNKANVLEKLGQYQDALENYNRALKLKPSNKSEIKMRRDNILYKLH